MLFYDFEVFAHDWLVVVIDMAKRCEHVIINDPDALEWLHKENVKEIWVGFNSRHYDQYIFKGILCGFDPKKINDFIILRGEPGWKFSSMFRNIPLNNYDVMNNTDRGLKTFEGFMGNDIRESSVPFDIDRKLTQQELDETVKYCRHDVQQTIQVFLKRSEEFNASRELIKLFSLPISSYSKTKAQLVSEICGGMGKQFSENEFDFPIVPCLQLKKYRYVLDWYKDPQNHWYSRNEKENKLETIVAGVPHTFSWGGIHGAKKKNTETGIFLMADVTAYYPSIQIQYKFGYRNMSKPENFELMHKQNLKYKAEGNKKARAPFKIADNSMSGQLKDKNSKLYDPLMNNAVCVNGQLMLLMLIEMVEPYVQLTQSNTDGILLKLKCIDDYDKIDDIVYEWECLTGMKMEFELFHKVYQKDVNNYILIGDDGKIKSKGAWVKKLSTLDYDLPIVNRALVEYMVSGVSVEQTVHDCHELKEFQLVTKITNKYSGILHGARYHKKDDGQGGVVLVFDQKGREIKEKCIRIFASTRPGDGGVVKMSKRTGKPEKIPNSPDHCFIWNDSVNEARTPDYLDRQWYIKMALDRLREFGVKP